MFFWMACLFLRCCRVSSDDVGWDRKHPLSSGRLRNTPCGEKSRPILQGPVQFSCTCTVDKHNISVLLIHNLKKKIPYNVLSNIFNKIINSYLYGCFFRFQSLGEESVWDWKWPMRLQQKTELRNRRRCGKSLKTSQGEEKVLKHTDWDCKKCLYFAFFSSLISIFFLQIISITIWVKRWMKN